MKKITVSLILMLLSYNVSAAIPRDNISDIRQLTWENIVNFSESYIFNTAIFVAEDGSLVYYPYQEKYGELGVFNSSGVSFSKQYIKKVPKFENMPGFGDYEGGVNIGGVWGVNKSDNTLCYYDVDMTGESCTYVFAGFENAKQSVYFSKTKNGDFHKKMNSQFKISNETTFNEWSLGSLEQQALNIDYVRRYITDLNKEIETNLLKLNALNGCEDCNLQRVNLSGANLSGADLSRSNLRGADLRGTDLSGANLPRANLRGTDLRGTDLSGANLAWVNFSGTDLTGANLSNTIINGAIFSRANLSGVDLSFINLLEKVNFSGANLSGANLRIKNIFEVNLRDANLSGADLSGADLTFKIDLTGANFTEANLSGVDLSRVDLSGANFSKANLSGANFLYANLSGANLSDAEIDGANYLSSATFCNTETPWGIDDSGC